MPKEKQMKPVMLVCKILSQDKDQKLLMDVVTNLPYFEASLEVFLMSKAKLWIKDFILRKMPYTNSLKITILNILPLSFGEYTAEVDQLFKNGINYFLMNSVKGGISSIKYIREDQIRESNWGKQFHGRAIDAISKQMFMLKSKELPIFEQDFHLAKQKECLMDLRNILERLLDDNFELHSMDIDKLVELGSKVALITERMQTMEDKMR